VSIRVHSWLKKNQLDGELRSLGKEIVGKTSFQGESRLQFVSGTEKSAGGAPSGITNDQRLKLIASVKRLLSLAAENAAPKTQAVIASVIIELARLEDSLM